MLNNVCLISSFDGILKRLMFEFLRMWLGIELLGDGFGELKARVGKEYTKK